jgi:hypothetical protein
VELYGLDVDVYLPNRGAMEGPGAAVTAT